MKLPPTLFLRALVNRNLTKILIVCDNNVTPSFFVYIDAKDKISSKNAEANSGWWCRTIQRFSLKSCFTGFYQQSLWQKQSCGFQY